MAGMSLHDLASRGDLSDLVTCHSLLHLVFTCHPHLLSSHSTHVTVEECSAHCPLDWAVGLPPHFPQGSAGMLLPQRGLPEHLS